MTNHHQQIRYHNKPARESALTTHYVVSTSLYTIMVKNNY